MSTSIPLKNDDRDELEERTETSPLLGGVRGPGDRRRGTGNDSADRDPDPGLSSSTIIEIPEDSSSTNPKPLEALYPPEILKTVVAGLFLGLCFYLNTVSLVLTHQRLPDRNTTQPLPDIIIDNLPTFEDGLYIAEVFIMFTTISTVVLLVLHRFRWIAFRRLFFILGLLYLYRGVTMFVTVFPVASYTYYCSPKLNPLTFLGVLERSLKLVSGFGLSINGEHVYCGDYMYSGHTVMLVTAGLVIQEYTPGHNWKWKVVHWFYWTLAMVGIVLVLFARGHYTIDVLIAYFVTTRVFWIFHTLSYHKGLKNPTPHNFLSKSWWYHGFQWIEGKVEGGKLPHHYSIPWLTQTFISFEGPPALQPRDNNQNSRQTQSKYQD